MQCNRPIYQRHSSCLRTRHTLIAHVNFFHTELALQPLFRATRFAMFPSASSTASCGLPKQVHTRGLYSIFWASSSAWWSVRSSSLRRNMTSVASNPFATAGEVMPTSRAATRPGMAAGVSTSAGRALDLDDIKSSGSQSVAGSASEAYSKIVSRTSLCPAVASAKAHVDACIPDVSTCFREQQP